MKRNQTFNPLQIAEVKLSYQTKVKAADRPKIASSADAAKIIKQWWDRDKIEFVEEFKILMLNRANKVLGIATISTGGISGTVADPKLIFSTALKANASAIILAHNHPSGNLCPSEADERLTKKVVAGGKFLEINVLDHLIITKDHYCSLADEKKMNFF